MRTVADDNLIPRSIAIWALTETGARLAQEIEGGLPGSTIFLPHRIQALEIPGERFERLQTSVGNRFRRFGGHVFIMSSGIVVRMIANHLEHKTTDPAVVVMDEQGQHVISLLSGHVGGANALTRLIAAVTGAEPVITTATDVHGLPAVDLMAKAHGLIIENPEAIKAVNLAILEGRALNLHDPYAVFENSSGNIDWLSWHKGARDWKSAGPGVYIDHKQAILPETVLVLRPKTLTAGIGCNRGTSVAEIKHLLEGVLADHGLSKRSLDAIASIDLKREEPGILKTARDLGCRTFFYTKEELNRVEGISRPSEVVRKHTGARSVCEAAALISSNMGKLIARKQKTKNATVAIARIPCTSSVSARAVRSRCPDGCGTS